MIVKSSIQVLISIDSDIEEAFKSMHQSIMTKIENYAREDCIAFECNYKAQY